MNTIKYQALIETVRCGSLTQAAINLSYSQPAVSHMIKSLEDSYGFALLHRASDKVTPTKDALKLIPYMNSIVYNEKSLNEEIDRINNIETGRINLGTYNSAMMSFLPGLIKLYTQAHPSIEINLVEGNYAEMHSFLREKVVDFAVVSKFDYPEYEFISIMDDELMAVLPPDHPLCGKERVTPEELFEYPLLATEENSDQDLREIMRIHQITPQIRMRAKQESSLLRLIASGLGVGIIPELYTNLYSQGIEVRKLDSPYNKRTIGIAAYSIETLSPASKEFIHIIPERLGAV